MRGTIMNYPLTLPTILEHAGRLHGAQEIVSRMPDKSVHRYRFSEFYNRTKKLADGLIKAGLKSGDRVGTLCWNHYAHLEAYFGVPCSGGVLHTLNLRLHADELAYIAKHAGDRFLIVDDDLLPILEGFRDKVDFERIFVVRYNGDLVPADMEDYEDLLDGATSEFTYPEIDEFDACGMCYTSGTTGKPKGVAYSHRGVVLHTLAVSAPDAFGLSMRDCILPIVPMFHANAWGMPTTAVMAGAKTVFAGPHTDHESVLELLESEQVSMTSGVPTVWLPVVDAMKREADRWNLNPALKFVIGGSAAPEAMIRDFDTLGHQVIHAWGMTEMTPVGTTGIPKPSFDSMSRTEQFATLAKQGIPLPFVDIRVVGDDGPAPWDGETMGELQVKGPWIADSYYEPDDPIFSWTDDGWFRTGDVVTVDPEGYVKITDRTKDLIKSGGEWISSVDVENALMGHPDIKEAAVIAMPHERWVERPLACIVLKEGAVLSVESVREFLADKFAKWWLPDAVEFIEEIPRTSTGKFQKMALRERFKDYASE
ncbi:MAG: long-chain fatty acid--CoA ligase [Rhodospirillaceae bacterium]|nr:long-chain fatty acid--CoA ligase [Rhodospirillaceae bacterium]